MTYNVEDNRGMKRDNPMKKSAFILMFSGYLALQACYGADVLDYSGKGVVEDTVSSSIRGVPHLPSTKDILDDLKKERDWEKIEKIDFGMNSLTSLGTYQIVQFAINQLEDQKLKNLKLIDFSFNRISVGDSDFSKFKEALLSLLKNPNCPEIRLEGNYFDPKKLFEGVSISTTEETKTNIFFQSLESIQKVKL